jgi:methyl-accepting chemotaxis protein
MGITLLALPQTQDRLGRIRAFGHTILDGEALSADEILQIAALAQQLRESDFDRVVSSTRTVLNEDANFYDISPMLRSKVEVSLEQYTSATENLLNVMQQVAADDAAVTSEDFENAVELAFVSQLQHLERGR